MAAHPLIQYVQEARRRGMTNRQIVDALTASGWQVHDVMDIMLDHGQPLQMAIETKDGDIITVRNVSKHYGKVKALDDVNLEVKQGRVTALLGPNGAGKTTLVRILTTLLVPDSGRAVAAGLDVVRDAKALRSIIGLAGQYAAVDESLTGRENLEMVARLYHLDAATSRQRAVELLAQFELTDAADRVLKTYSGGMRRRLDLAASLIIRPKILFLDEPTTGLDPRGRFGMWRVIEDLVEDGTTVLLTTQYLEEADQLADYIFVIDHGHIIAQGTADELKRQVGGDVLELHVTNHAETIRAADIVHSFGSDEPRIDQESGVLTMPVSGDAKVLVDVIRELDAAKIKISDIVLRRPSLDDVFMKLTGHTAI